MEEKKYNQSVLTYIFGKYELLHEVQQVDDDTEYICVTDNEELTSSTWTMVYWNGKDTDNAFDKVCYVRYHPFEFVHTDTVIKVDGSIIVKGSVRDFVRNFEGSDICLMMHPDRYLPEQEFDQWIKSREYPVEQKEKCMKYLKEIGADQLKGLYQTGLQIQKNDDINNEINDRVYKVICELGIDNHVERIDQIIFSSILNKYYTHLNVLITMEWIITGGKTFCWCYHNTETPIPRKEHQIQPYLFDEEV